MIAKTFPRETRPDFLSLSTTLAPLLAPANAGSFHLAWTGTAVRIEQEAWDNIDLSAVQTAVDAATPYSTVEAADLAEAAAATALKLPTPAEIDALVDAIFSGLTAPQRTFLRRLAKLVRRLVERHGL